MQNLKAVAMGMVAARALFWSKKPYPAMPRMAGLGLFDQKSVRALAPRGLLKSAYDFLCLIYTKSSRASWKVPGQF